MSIKKKKKITYKKILKINLKKKKKEEAVNVGKKKSVKKSNVSEGTIVHRHFHSKMMSNFSLQFSLYFREKTFW